jgi:nucleotide-binding universal stress UspA family protein
VASSTAGIDTGLSVGVLSAEIWDEVIASSKKTARAAHHTFQKFIADNGIRAADRPDAIAGLSASWREEEGDFTRLVTRAALVNDVVVIGRPSAHELLPEAGSILSGCGRPVLLAPQRTPEDLTSTIAIAWKETAEAARAVTAAMPLLRRATKVLILSVSEDDDATRAERSASCLADKLRWHGLNVVPHHVPRDTLSAPEALMAVASEMRARLVVMGGYGHSRAYEFVFGGFTRHALAQADLPILMAH